MSEWWKPEWWEPEDPGDPGSWGQVLFSALVIVAFVAGLFVLLLSLGSVAR